MPWRELMLSRTPQWETAYRGIKDARYAEHEGLYFEVTVSAETGWLFVDRISHAGHYLGEFAAAPGYAEAKALMRAWAARPPVPDAAFDGPHVRQAGKAEAHQRAKVRRAAQRVADPEGYRAAKDRELAVRRARTVAKRQRQGDQGTAA